MAIGNSRFVEGHWSGSNDPIPYNPTPVVAPYERVADVAARLHLGRHPVVQPLHGHQRPELGFETCWAKTFDGTVDHPFEWVSALNPRGWRTRHRPSTFRTWTGCSKMTR